MYMKGWLLSAASFLLCLPPLHAQQMQYVVFELDSQLKVEPLFHTLRSTTLASWPNRPKAIGRPQAGTDGVVRLHARAYAGDKLLYAEVLELMPWARAPGGPQEAVVHAGTVALDHTAFALRLPENADRLILDSGVALKSFDLQLMQAKSADLPLAGFGRDASVAIKSASGSSANRVDILVMGEGYTAEQGALFHTRVDEFEAGFFNYRPLREYESLFNVARLHVPSAQSGSDHPPYRDNCNGADCCADTAAQNDILAPRFVDTAFDGSFCSGGRIHRALGIHVGKLLAAASAVPDWDVIVVLVNDPVFGGLGYLPSPDRSMPGIATGSAANAIPLITHELGHALGLLGDEYEIDSISPSPPYCSDRQVVGGCLDNHTDETDPERVKWRHWFTPGLAIPSPEFAAGVGLFEGVLGIPSGIYRPTHRNCMMSVLGRRFCPVCAEAMVATLYDGRFGHPAAGIDLIEPGSEFPDPAQPVALVSGRSQRFSASVLQPQVDSIERQWLLDGVPLADADADALDLVLDGADGAQRTLELRVVDRGPYLGSERVLPLAVHSRSWNLQVEAPSESFAICSALSGAWFNPDTAGQGVFLDVAEDPALLFAGWFTWGNETGTREWFTAQGGYTPGDAAAELPLLQTSGGRFDDPTPVAHVPVGEIDLQFLDCERAMLEYRFDDGRSGVVPLKRLLPAPEQCAEVCRP
jgi:hypothetical protein